MKMKQVYGKVGFTLIELLLVVIFISLLAVGVFVALSPAKRISDTKNSRRSQDVTTILSAIHQSVVDNRGTLPTKLATLTAGREMQIGTATSGCAISGGTCNVLGGTDCIDLMTDTDAPQNLINYLATMPIDPTGTPGYDSSRTGYSVVVSTVGIVTVKSCAAEGTTIVVSR